MLTSLPALQIFRAGSYPQGTFSVADLHRIAAGYDPAWHEAPCCIGHGDDGAGLSAAAYGWVKRLWVEGDVLLADVDEVPSKFADAVAAGRFKKRSAGIYTALALRDGGTGPYLRHVAWVPIPQVKGLADPAIPAITAASGSPRRPAFNDQTDWSFVPCPPNAEFGMRNAESESAAATDSEIRVPNSELAPQEVFMSDTITTTPPSPPPTHPSTADAPEPSPINPQSEIRNPQSAEPTAPTTRIPVSAPADSEIAARVDCIVREAAGRVVEEFRRQSARTHRLDQLAAFFGEMVRQGRVTPAQAEIERRALERIADAVAFSEADAELLDAKQREIRSRPALELFGEPGRRGRSATSFADAFAAAGADTGAGEIEQRVGREFAEHKGLFERIGVRAESLLALAKHEAGCAGRH